METDPFARFNPESSPEKSDKDSASEKKSEKKRSSFIDELIARRNTKTSEHKKSDDQPTDFGEKKKLPGAEEEPAQKALAKEFLEQKATDLRGEIATGTDKEEVEEAQTDLDFVTAIAEKINDPDQEVEPAVQEAYEELLDAISELEADEAESDDEALSLEDSGDAEEAPQSTALPIVGQSSSISGARSTSTTATTPRSTAPSTTPPTPRQPLPPQPPVASRPNHATPPTERTPETHDDQRQRKAGKVVVGGTIGSILERRSERKRTEARLEREIKRRDETIIDLKKDIEAKEIQLRSATRQHETPITERPLIVEEKEAHSPSLREIVERPIEVEQKRPELPKGYEDKPEQSKAAPPPFIEKTAEAKIPEVTKHIETIPTPTLLHMAEKIKVLDTNVRRLYETNQIDRKGLEEIVREHLRGHDIAPVLDKRLLGKEAILDRSHEYRHDPATGLIGRVASDDATNTIPASNQPSVTAEDKPSHPPLHIPHTSSTHQTANATESGDSQEPKKQPTATLTGIVIVALLIAIFTVWLLFSL